MSINTDPNLIEELLTRGVAAVYPSADALRERLGKGEKLSLYFGIDPTGPDLHLGHATSLLKLKDFEALGHEVVLLIGGFTARIGDPTDKTAARTAMTAREVKENAKGYRRQVATTGLRPSWKDNGKWFDRMGIGEWMDISSNFTVQRLLERDMFEKRMKEGKPIHAHEFMYPMMQAYDSVALGVDGEVGGNDQTFNMLAGRDLMKSMLGKDKVVIAMNLLVDPTGKKMGKSEGNMAKLTDTPENMYGKIMSWTDGMIVPAFESLTRVGMEEIREMARKMEEGENPKRLKERLAKTIVAQFHGAQAAEEAEAAFSRVFEEHKAPEDMPALALEREMTVVDALVEAKLASSKSEARRLVEGGGVKLGGEVVDDIHRTVRPDDAPVVLQKGKRHFVRLVK